MYLGIEPLAKWCYLLQYWTMSSLYDSNTLISNFMTQVKYTDGLEANEGKSTTLAFCLWSVA
jgi:hypothetical protein